MNYDLKDKKVVIIGLGRSGLAAARYVASRGARTIILEKKQFIEVKDAVTQLEGLPFEFFFGSHDPELLTAADLIVVSPGVPLDVEGLGEARGRSIPIIGELELAVSRINKPMIAVTGTNGKTTTTTLIGHVLQNCNIKACVGGNIGTALTDLIEEARSVDWVVVEVSSFQLETTPSLSPKVAVLLNITPDHLDRHASFEEYARIKGRLFTALGTGDFGIYNAGDAAVQKEIKNASARLLPFHAGEKLESGAWFENGELVLELPGHQGRRFSLAKVSLPGIHNRENMLAAAMVGTLCGGSQQDIQRGLNSFRGLPHRMELVAREGGVSYYDDSKGTNVGATAAALENFEAPIILIAGGQDKGTSYEPLAPLIRRRVKKMILVGESKEKMKRELGHHTETILSATMQEAVRLACAAASPGDVVLLSPACASFDMFKDYAERGEVFARAVREILQR